VRVCVCVCARACVSLWASRSVAQPPRRPIPGSARCCSATQTDRPTVRVRVLLFQCASAARSCPSLSRAIYARVHVCHHHHHRPLLPVSRCRGWRSVGAACSNLEPPRTSPPPPPLPPSSSSSSSSLLLLPLPSSWSAVVSPLGKGASRISFYSKGRRRGDTPLDGPLEECSCVCVCVRVPAALHLPVDGR